MSTVRPPGDGTQPCLDDPGLFFAENTSTSYHAKAKRMCREQCPFTEDCREYALRFDLYGVWGATTRDERCAIQRRTGAVAADQRRREHAAMRARITELDDGMRSLAKVARQAGCTDRFAQKVRAERRAAQRTEGGAAA